MSASWPVSLPQLVLQDGFQEQPPNTVVGWSPDSGPDKLRRRFTAGPRPLKLNLVMTWAQVETFDQWFRDTLADGALPFDWVHPRTGLAVTLRFKAGQPPVYTPERPGAVTWLVSASVEVMP